MPYTYIVRCSDDTYYVGSTWDVEARVWQHNSPDLGAMYTRHRQPVTLAWCCWFDSIEQAFMFEKRIQGWSRKKREALIRGDYDALPDLSRRLAVQRRRSEQGGGFEAQALARLRTSTTVRPPCPSHQPPDCTGPAHGFACVTSGEERR